MLNEKNKKDRETMANAVEALTTKHGLTYDRHESEYKSRCIDINITHPASGLSVHVDFDGASPQPNVFCLPWHFNGSTDKCLHDRFGVSQSSSVNSFHFHKCTAFAYGWDDFIDMLEQGFILAISGRGFCADREAASIAKNGTAESRNAKWAQYREEFASRHLSTTAK